MPILSKINRDLQEEREKVQFNVEEFTNWFYGGADKVKKRKELEKYFLSDPELNLSLDTSYLSYKEKYEEAIRRNVLIYPKLIKLFDHFEDQGQILEILKTLHLLQSTMNKEGEPFLLQFSMFAFMLTNLTNDEQKAEWLPRVVQCNLLGTYAQTELGHGSNLKGLETTATYEPKTKEFIMNTPTLTAYKWWPGNMGHTVNYAVVMAQLYSLSKHHGIQPFIVQLRDEETHKPLPGITVGDIGNKLGYNTWNNGFLAFDNVRIPLKNMLMKSAQILESGEFIRKRQSVTNYGAMVMMRVSIVHDTAVLLAKATTIALRYSMVRRQSPINPDEPEPKIIEHVTQQFKIFPAIARTIVYNIAGNYLLSATNELKQNIEINLDKMNEFHALTCGLKAIVSTCATKDIETCRLSCGGHGFLESAGFINLYRNCTTAETGEGENTVVLLQTARYLMKTVKTIKNGEKITSGVFYIAEFMQKKEKRSNFDDTLQGMLESIQMAAAGRIESAWKSIEAKIKFMSPEEATNHAGIELVRGAQLHCHAFFLETAIKELSSPKENISKILKEVLRNVLELFAVDLTLSLLGDILQFVNVSSSDVERLQKRLENSLKFFRTAAIGIVDGFDFSDELLNSTLGAYDGNVYERLYEAAKKSPLNQEEVNKSFHLYLKPLMKSNL